jgi:hypothetical protein
MTYKVLKSMESKDSVNSISKYSESPDANGKLKIKRISHDTTAKIAVLDIYSGNKRSPYLPWSMSAKLVRYRIRDDSFNTSGMWSVAGIYYPVPKLNWWYRPSKSHAWKLVSTVYAAPAPGKAQDTSLTLENVGSSGWQVVAAFSDTAPTVKSSSSKPSHFDLFSTDVFTR